MIISQWFDPEPSPIVSMAFVSYLTSQGHKVHVLTGYPNYPHGVTYTGYKMKLRETSELSANADITRVAEYAYHGSNPFKRVLAYLGFATVAGFFGLPKGKKFDVIYAYQGQATIGIPALLARFKYKAPVILHVQDFWPDTVLESGFIPKKVVKIIDRPLRWLCKHVYKSVNHSVGLSPGMSELLLAHGVKAENSTTIYNWAEESRFLPKQWEATPASNERTVIYAGNLGPFQRLDIAIRAAVETYKTNKEFRLHIVGAGPDKAKLVELVKELKAENVILGESVPYDEMCKLNHKADALLVCLDKLPFFESIVPSKCQVGMASGRVVVAALEGDARNLLEQSGCTVMCRSGSVEDLHRGFVELCSMTDSQMAAMGKAGREYYLDHLSFEVGMGKLESVMLAQAATNSPA